MNAQGLADPLTPAKADRHAWPLVWAMMLAMTLYIIDRQMLGLLAPSISKELGLTDSQLGLAGGIGYSLIYCVVSMPWAWIADRPRTSRVWVVSAALTVWSAATAVCGAVQSFTHLLLARMGVAAGEAGCIPPAQALIAETVPRQQLARAMAIFGLGIPLGAFVGKAGGGFLSEQFGWRNAFLLVGAPGVFLALLMVVFFRDRRKVLPPSLDKPCVERAWKHIVRSPTLIYIALGNAFTGGLSAIIAFWGMVHFQRNLGLSPAEAGLWLGLQAGSTGLVGNLIGGWAADRMAVRKTSHYLTPAVIGQLIAPPFLVFGWLTDLWWLALLLTLLPIMCDNLAYGGTNAATQQLIPSDIRSTATALLSIMVLLGSGFGVTLLGMASDGIHDLLPPDVSPSLSLRYVLIGSSFLFFLPAFFYWRAGRTLEAELAET